jgi:hypothetical protein
MILDVSICGRVASSFSRSRTKPFLYGFRTCVTFNFQWEAATLTDSNYAHYRGVRDAKQIFRLFRPLQRDCRSLIESILEPNPANRALASDVVADPWFGELAVCVNCHVENGQKTHRHF